MNTWDENVGLKADNVIKLLEEQFRMKIGDIYFIANGWDNDVYKINNKYLFRFPRRDIANKLIEKEGNTLPIIKQYVSTPLPNPVFFGNPTNDLSIEEIVAINSMDSIIEAVLGSDFAGGCPPFKEKSRLKIRCLQRVFFFAIQAQQSS